jgi:hypothetical protein
MYDAHGENTSGASVSLYSSSIFHFVSSIFRIPVIVRFFHPFASTVYTCASSIGFISAVPRDIGAP